MSRVRKDEAGFTLPELMLALSIGMLIIFAALAVVDSATRNNAEVQRRSAGIQQGRMALDDVVRRLRSQTCVQPNDVTLSPPFVAASGTSVSFYSDFTDGNTGLPERHTLTVDANGTLTDTTVKGTGTRTATAFTSTATVRTVAERIVGTGTVPIFQFFAFNTAIPPAPDTPLNSLASPTVATADLTKIARIVVSMRANPEGSADPKLATTLQDQVTVRLADPDDSAPTPRCA